MKAKIFILVAALMTLSVSASAQQDPLDWGAPDSIIMQFSHTPDLQAGDSIVQLELIVVNDSILGGIGPGFKWTNTGMTMTSAAFTEDGIAAFDFKQMVYYRNKKDSTNSNQKFQAVGLYGDPTTGLPPGRTVVATYSLKLTAAVDTIVIDSSLFQPFSVVTTGNTEYAAQTNLPIKFAVPQGVKPVDNGSLPTSFGLSQNYPNPFNPTTSINFALPQASQVELSIFNVLGQRVITLINDKLPAKYYEVTWDGVSEGGQQVASGIYFYRLTAGDFVATKKMMMLK